MRSKTRPLSELGGVALLAILAGFLQGTARADDGDPPGRVARLSDTEGTVSLEPAGLDDWTAATVNRPLTTGDRLWSNAGSRAELDLGAAVIRLGEGTGFAFLNLDDRIAQMQLIAGTLIVEVRDLQPGDGYEVDTPNVALTLQQPGVYRVEVGNPGDATVVNVSEGAAEAAGGGETVAIGPQQSVRFTGTDTLAFDSSVLGAPDDLDNWSAARERQAEDSSTGEYVAPDVPGTQDLDGNGEWQTTPQYGYVWTPTAVVAGWVPYRFGHWVWIAPWGWTWIDDAPWGFAPFHYGRWVQWHGGWSWVPGPRHGRPVYAPALVAWVGGPAVGTSVAFGNNVGWFPLAPREVYVPAYRGSPSYIRTINITNTTLTNNSSIPDAAQRRATPTHYANERATAVTTIPRSIFTSGQRISGHAVQLSAAALTGAAVAAAAPAIAPIPQSVLGPSEGRGAIHPPAAFFNRTVAVRTQPPRAPAPFDKQLAAIQANGGRPLAAAEVGQLQPATPAAHVRLVAATHRVVATRAPAAPAAIASGHAASKSDAPMSLAERERTLQRTSLPPAPHTAAPVTSARDKPDVYVPPGYLSQVRDGRSPASTDPRPAATSPNDARGGAHPAAAPAPRAAAVTQNNVRAPVSQRTESSKAPAPAKPAQQTQSAAHPQPAKEPRDTAAHGDRDSRDRVLR
jgi:hypothetical protein